MAGFHSYIPLLIKYLRMIKPSNILEWGPGESTKLMIREAPKASIVSIENNREWFNKYSVDFKNYSRVKVLFLEDEAYWNFIAKFSLLKYELIFVDGFCDYRVNCLKTAFNLVSKDGVVILHNSDRSKYDEGRKGYRLIEEIDGTAVMKLG